MTPWGAHGWRRCAAPALVCDAHGAAATGAAEKRARRVAGAAGMRGCEAAGIVAAWRERLAPHRVAQDRQLNWGRPEDPPSPDDVLMPEVFLRRRRDGETPDAGVSADDRCGISARPELADVLPALLAKIGEKPRAASEAWAALDPFGRVAFARVARSLGLLVVCRCDGSRI